MGNSFNIQLKIVSDVPVIYIEGDMTSEADSEIIEKYNEISNKDSLKNIIVNFEKTNYINSAGLATLINVIHAMESHGGVVILTKLTAHFLRVMDIIGITDLVSIFDTDEEAIQFIHSSSKK